MSKNDKRLDLIKILLSYAIENNRQQEDFMEILNDNSSLFNIDVSPKMYLPYDKIAERLKIEEEDEAEKIEEFLSRTDKSMEELVEEFCEKYHI